MAKLLAQITIDWESIERDIAKKDIVKIVRCKDCRYGVDYYHEGDCYCSNPKWGLKYFGGSWNFYCADAERRTEDDET